MTDTPVVPSEAAIGGAMFARRCPKHHAIGNDYPLDCEECWTNCLAAAYAVDVAPIYAAKKKAEHERDKWQERAQAVFSPSVHPQSHELLAVIKRLPQKDARIIDRAFMEGATMLAAAEVSLRQEREALVAKLREAVAAYDEGMVKAARYRGSLAELKSTIDASNGLRAALAAILDAKEGA